MYDSTAVKKVANSALAGIAARHDLAGKRYISWLRCSTLHQADTSPDGQKEVNDWYATLQQMQWAGYDYYAEGVSGSQTFNREDVEEILALKRTRNDFDAVVVFEYGRATRGGIRHGNLVEDAFKKAGIELISSTELIPDGPLGDLIKCIKHFSNQQQAFNISKSVARGLAQSLARAARPAAGRTPFGLDRLYVGPDGTPRTLIRWDGCVQRRLDPDTKIQISEATRPPTRKPRTKGQSRRPDERRTRFVGYRKQDDETSLLTIGSEHAHATVVEMWRMRYCEDIGPHRIIQRMRQRGLMSPTGGDWNMTSVLNILNNPIYLGVEVRHRWTKALYHKLSPDGPVPVKVDQDKLQQEGRVSVPQIERSRDEWVLVDKPELKDFLPADVRQAALPYITSLYDTDAVAAKQAKKQKRKSKHDDNPYVLSHILRSKQTGHRMRGDTNTKKDPKAEGGRKVRRYYFDYSTASKAISGLCARRVRAEPLEEAIVPAVFDVLLDHAWITDRVRAYVASLSTGVRDVEQERHALKAEQAEITRRLKRIHKSSGNLGDDDLEALVADDNARLIAIRREIIRLDHSDEERPPTADEAVAAVVQRLTTVPTTWRSLPSAELKILLNAVVADLQIDLSTSEVTLNMGLPTAATAAIRDESASNCRVSFTSAWSSLTDAGPIAIPIDEVRCVHVHNAKSYNCHRCRRAA